MGVYECLHVCSCLSIQKCIQVIKNVSQTWTLKLKTFDQEWAFKLQATASYYHTYQRHAHTNTTALQTKLLHIARGSCECVCVWAENAQKVMTAVVTAAIVAIQQFLNVDIFNTKTGADQKNTLIIQIFYIW